MAISAEKQQKIHTKRKKQILDAAIHLFDTKGFADTKISDIAERAKISKGLVYRYFESKEAILFALNDRLKHCIDECYAVPSGRDAIRLFSMRLLSYPYYEDYVPPFRTFFTAIIRGDVNLEGLDFPVSDDFGKEYFGSLFQRGQQQGDFKAGDPAVYGDFYWKYLLGYLASLKPGQESQPDVDSILALFEKKKTKI
jgi:AcrR family transcriptional regulator